MDIRQTVANILLVVSVVASSPGDTPQVAADLADGQVPVGLPTECVTIPITLSSGPVSILPGDLERLNLEHELFKNVYVVNPENSENFSPEILALTKQMLDEAMLSFKVLLKDLNINHVISNIGIVLVNSDLQNNSLVPCQTEDGETSYYITIRKNTIEMMASTNPYQRKMAVASLVEEVWHAVQRLEIIPQTRETRHGYTGLVNEYLMHVFQGLGLFEYSVEDIIPPYNKHIHRILSRTTGVFIHSDGNIYNVGSQNTEPYSNGYLTGAALKGLYPNILEALIENPARLLSLEVEARNYITDNGLNLEDLNDALIIVLGRSFQISRDDLRVQRAIVHMNYLKKLSEESDLFWELTIHEREAYQWGWALNHEGPNTALPTDILFTGDTIVVSQVQGTFTTNSKLGVLGMDGRFSIYEPGSSIHFSGGNDYHVLINISGEQGVVELRREVSEQFSGALLASDGLISAALSALPANRQLMYGGGVFLRIVQQDEISNSNRSFEFEGQRYEIVTPNGLPTFPNSVLVVIPNSNPDILRLESTDRWARYFGFQPLNTDQLLENMRSLQGIATSVNNSIHFLGLGPEDFFTEDIARLVNKDDLVQILDSGFSIRMNINGITYNLDSEAAWRPGDIQGMNLYDFLQEFDSNDNFEIAGLRQVIQLSDLREMSDIDWFDYINDNFEINFSGQEIVHITRNQNGSLIALSIMGFGSSGVVRRVGVLAEQRVIIIAFNDDTPNQSIPFDFFRNTEFQQVSPKIMNRIRPASPTIGIPAGGSKLVLKKQIPGFAEEGDEVIPLKYTVGGCG